MRSVTQAEIKEGLTAAKVVMPSLDDDFCLEGHCEP